MRSKPETTKPKIALIASKECQSQTGKQKDWYHIRKFLDELKKSNYETKFEIYTNTYASKICAEVNIHVNPVPDDEFQSIIFLASEIALKEIKTVLIFQDPDDLKIESVHTYALLRNCDLAGAFLYFNKSIELWLHDLMSKPKSERAEKEHLALISHDHEKPRMMRFAYHYRETLKKFHIIATSGTREKIMSHLKDLASPQERFKIDIAGGSDKDSHGPSGGDVIIANEIFKIFQRSNTPYDKSAIYHVIFFMDHKNLQPHQADIQVLLKTCLDPNNKVNLITNSRTAEKWANSI
jgi:methylglyoxal synthase